MGHQNVRQIVCNSQISKGGISQCVIAPDLFIGSKPGFPEWISGLKWYKDLSILSSVRKYYLLCRTCARFPAFAPLNRLKSKIIGTEFFQIVELGIILVEVSFFFYYKTFKQLL